MPNKGQDVSKEPKAAGSPLQQPCPKLAGGSAKAGAAKAIIKDTAMSPTPPVSTEDPELLGSLTTVQQQRTSARVIKKLKLDPVVDNKRVEIQECETPIKLEDKDLKFPTVKQRMPKALWSTEEKNYFFEALNEYGKDFDAITAYICAKMKKKGMVDANLKTKTQVSHFYYRTWHKLSKHVQFDENVKKVAQELYALINYGELRRKLVAVSEKTCARLGELVARGSLLVRARGRNRRVRTPACRALRKLNHISESGIGARSCTRCTVCLRARSTADWARVQAAAHNPRARLQAPPNAALKDVLAALSSRWTPGGSCYKRVKLDSVDSKTSEDTKDLEDFHDLDEEEDLEDHLHLETDRVITQELKVPKKPVLHVGPRAGLPVHLPTVVPSEPLSSHKICFSSYLERMSQRGDKFQAKNRTPKRQRKDSTNDKDKEVEAKKCKMEECDVRLINIEETAIDGIELMASYRHHDDDEKPSTEDEKEVKSEETAEEERDVPVDKYDLSEMDDMDKSESDNETESDHNTERRFNNLKVKFRIRPKKRGGSMYTVVLNKDLDDSMSKKDLDESKSDSKTVLDHIKQNEDSKHYLEQPKHNSEDPKLNLEDSIHNLEAKSNLETKTILESKSNLETKSNLESKSNLETKTNLETRTNLESKSNLEAKPNIEDPKAIQEDETEEKSDMDVEFAMRQISKGWSIYDSGELTVGDLYLMFGSRSKLELDYWWAEPTPPLPKSLGDKTHTPDKDKECCTEDCDKRESDAELLSPKAVTSQDSRDGLSGDERKSEQQVSPDYKSSASSTGSLKLANKLINRPTQVVNNNAHLSQLSDRLKRLLSLAGNPYVNASSCRCECDCGHVCHRRANVQKQPCGGPSQDSVPTPPAPTAPTETATVFRHPTPIAPRHESETQPQPSPSSCLDGLPRWRRGRPRLGLGRVVVQRLLPLLPKLPAQSNLIPVKIVPNTLPPPPRILPKPPPTSTSDLSFFYVLSESNGQFYFHDGDRRIPISPITAAGKAEPKEEEIKEEGESSSAEPKPDARQPDVDVEDRKLEVAPSGQTPDENNSTDKPDIATDSFLPMESMSVSPSRLLGSDNWPEGAVQDFSLSSFLLHLERQPSPVVDAQLQSLLAESSVDYVAKFADLAAEVTDETPSSSDDI